MKSRRRVRTERPGGRPAIDERNGIAVIRMGSANIWDGGDLIRLREQAARVFEAGGRRIGIDLSQVGVLPSGFVHMLCSWQDRGADVYLFAPRPNVRDMLWFRHFAEPESDDVWRMTCAPPEQTWPENQGRGPRVYPAERSCDAVASSRADPDAPSRV